MISMISFAINDIVKIKLFMYFFNFNIYKINI